MASRNVRAMPMAGRASHERRSGAMMRRAGLQPGEDVGDVGLVEG